MQQSAANDAANAPPTPLVAAPRVISSRGRALLLGVPLDSIAQDPFPFSAATITAARGAPAMAHPIPEPEVPPVTSLPSTNTVGEPYPLSETGVSALVVSHSRQ